MGVLERSVGRVGQVGQVGQVGWPGARALGRSGAPAADEGKGAVYVRGVATGYKGGPGWADPYHCEWSIVVGDRVRRLRRARGWTLYDLRHAVAKPEGGRYSVSTISRLERGWASAPLYVYLAVADALGVEPGRLLGPDDAEREVTEGEMTMLRVLRRTRIHPHEALVRLGAAGRAS